MGKVKAGDDQSSTLGRFYSVEYALIKVQGAINRANLGRHGEDDEIANAFNSKLSMVFGCLWHGTNQLITRSKYPQRSILYIDVDYKEKTYNDLPMLVDENAGLRGPAKELGKKPFDFSRLVQAMGERSSTINKIRICGARDIEKDVSKLATDLADLGIQVETLSS